jgi:hypothetical protein
MKVLDIEQGMFTEVGEYWEPNDESPTRVIIDASLNEVFDTVEFSFNEGFILGVPVDRLKKLLRESR